MLVYDYYIPFESSLFLKGDDRGVADPLLGPYGQDRSRITVIIDRETGRGVVMQTETCTTGIGANFCNEPRPITFDMDDGWENDSENDATGEGINIDQTNQFEIEADGDSVTLSYDALNSITPLAISVDGTVEINRQSDGSYEKGTDTRDDYPAKVIYHYRPGEEPDGIYDDKDIHPDQVDGALPLDPDINSCTAALRRQPVRPRPRAMHRLRVILVAGVLALAGCGGEDEPAAAPTPTATRDRDGRRAARSAARPGRLARGPRRQAGARRRARAGGRRPSRSGRPAGSRPRSSCPRAAAPACSAGRTGSRSAPTAATGSTGSRAGEATEVVSGRLRAAAAATSARRRSCACCATSAATALRSRSAT